MFLKTVIKNTKIPFHHVYKIIFLKLFSKMKMRIYFLCFPDLKLCWVAFLKTIFFRNDGINIEINEHNKYIYHNYTIINKHFFKPFF